MPKRSNKKGGAFEYAKMFDFPLSPCYKPTGKPEIPRAGWHAGGGAACDAEPSVAKMGIVDKPACSNPTASELAWDNRYTEPKMSGGDNNNNNNSNKNNKSNNNKNNNNSKKNTGNANANANATVKPAEEMMPVGESIAPTGNTVAAANANFIGNLRKNINANTGEKTAVFTLNANKDGVKTKIIVIHNPKTTDKKFVVVVSANKNNGNAYFERNTLNSVVNKIKNYAITKLTRTRSNDANVNQTVTETAETVTEAPANNAAKQGNNTMKQGNNTMKQGNNNMKQGNNAAKQGNNNSNNNNK